MLTVDVFLHKVLQLRNREVVSALFDLNGISYGIAGYKWETIFEESFTEEDLFSDSSYNELLLVDISASISVKWINVDLIVMNVAITRSSQFFRLQTTIDLLEFMRDFVQTNGRCTFGPTFKVLLCMIYQVFMIVIDLSLEFIEYSTLQRVELSVSNYVC